MYVHYGSHFKAPKEWTNFDASPTLKWESIPLIGKIYTKNSQRFPPNVKCGDIVKGLPVPDKCCRGVYASHVLEHLALNDFHRAIGNTKKILTDGGIFRLVVPDMEWAAREYVRRLEHGDSAANKFFLDATCLGVRERPRGLPAIVHNHLRTSAHLWMWDSASLCQALKDHGFTRVRRCFFGDCEDKMFALVEDEGRFENAIGIEARG